MHASDTLFYKQPRKHHYIPAVPKTTNVSTFV